ncbi:hypothetical protein DFQ29_005298 [Apophysomyces sp. BC1021]|nr:hypothetical protein DFQ29_005298 [Apophysomyces sp. BC1021]
MAENLTTDGKCAKHIIKHGQGKTPENDSVVKIHYEACVVGHDVPFDSSRARHAPFLFSLNDGQVVKAWELAIPTMKVGEIAEIICENEYGKCLVSLTRQITE